MKTLRFALVALLALTSLAYAAPKGVIGTSVELCDPWSPLHCAKPDANGALPITGSFSIAFPTIGAPVPATGLYTGFNVAGNLRGWSGIATGSLFAGAIAIVDASGNQITSFGGSAANVSNTGSPVPAAAAYLGLNSSGNLVGWVGDATNGAWVNVKASALPANAAQETGGNLATIVTNTASIVTNTTSIATNTATTNTDIGPPGATACASDTGSCSLNALMQRIAQRITTLIGSTLTVTGNVGINPAQTGLTVVKSGAVESSHVLKGSAGVLWDLQVTSGASAGFVLIFDATSAPADGAVTPSKCFVLPASSSLSLSYNPGPTPAFATGITAVFSTTGCFTKTASATAYFSGEVQ